MSQAQETQKLLVKIPVAAKMCDYSRAKMYQMAASGELKGVVRMGRSVRVSVDALREWIANNTDRTA